MLSGLVLNLCVLRQLKNNFMHICAQAINRQHSAFNDYLIVFHINYPPGLRLKRPTLPADGNLPIQR